MRICLIEQLHWPSTWFWDKIVLNAFFLFQLFQITNNFDLLVPFQFEFCWMVTSAPFSIISNCAQFWWQEEVVTELLFQLFQFEQNYHNLRSLHLWRPVRSDHPLLHSRRIIHVYRSAQKEENGTKWNKKIKISKKLRPPLCFNTSHSQQAYYTHSTKTRKKIQNEFTDSYTLYDTLNLLLRCSGCIILERFPSMIDTHLDKDLASQ